MKNKKTALTLYSLHIPLMIALALVIGVGTVSATNTVINNNANVLGDDDEKGDSEDKEDKQEEKKKESEKKESEKKREESKKVEEKKKEESKRVEVKTNNYKSVQKSETEYKEEDKEDEQENKIENSYKEKTKIEENYGDDNELERHEEKAVVSSVTNEDGTITKTIKNVDGDEIETKIITYDAAGKIINKVELNEDGSEDTEKVELVTTVTNEDGTITKTFKKSEGTKVEMKSLTYDASGVLIKKAELNADGSIKEEEIINEDKNDNETENEIEVENEDEFKVTFKPTADGSVDPALSKIISAKLEQEIEKDTRLGTTVNKVELEIKTIDGTIKYEGTAESTAKLFGLFDIQIASDIEVDPVTGNITAVNQSFWNKVASFFSI